MDSPAARMGSGTENPDQDRFPELRQLDSIAIDTSFVSGLDVPTGPPMTDVARPEWDQPPPFSDGPRRDSIIRRFSIKTTNGLRLAGSRKQTRDRDAAAGPTIHPRGSSATQSIAADTDDEDDVDIAVTGSSAASDRNSPGDVHHCRPRTAVDPGGDTGLAAAADNGNGNTSSSSNPASAGPPNMSRPTGDPGWSGSLMARYWPKIQAGMVMTKISAKKLSRDLITVSLDPAAAKIKWDNRQLYIDDIRKFRTGINATHDREKYNATDEDPHAWLTIVYTDPRRTNGRHTKVLNLIAPGRDALAAWLEALQHIQRSRLDLMSALHKLADKDVATLWANMVRRPDCLDRSGTVDFRTLFLFCKGLHISNSEADMRAKFDAVDSDRHDRLSFSQFKRFLHSFYFRPELKDMFDYYATDHSLSLDSFLNFLNRVQGIETDSDAGYWAKWFRKCAAVESGEARMRLSGFRRFLASKANSPVAAPEPKPVLDQPLNDYFISSSHNTYLTGRQIIGEANTEQYVSVLAAGCRCVEIDCWDGLEGEPEVTHGRTGTTRIPFESVVKVINRDAFLTNHFPVILSLEVHCNQSQQVRMVDIMKSVFGARLVEKPISDAKVLPSPDELVDRVLIKVKAPAQAEPKRARGFSSPFSRPVVDPPPQVGLGLQLSGPSSLSNLSTSALPSIPPTPPAAAMPTPAATSTTTPTTTSPTVVPQVSSITPKPFPSTSPNSADESETKKHEGTSNITPVLGALGVYLRGIKFTSTFDGPGSGHFNVIHSLSESAFLSMCKDNKEKERKRQALALWCMKHMVRVYPKFSRFASSNFDPLVCWRRGVQMAALNYQTNDIQLQVNTAMFGGGAGTTGYVLKPAEMRLGRSGRVPGPDGYPYVKPEYEVALTVKIISGQELSTVNRDHAGNPMNPYVELELHTAEDKERQIPTGDGGETADRAGNITTRLPLRKRTRIVAGNGSDPMFRETLTMARPTKYPDLTFVRFSVYHSTDGKSYSGSSSPLASFMVKLSLLQRGFRYIPLDDSNGERFVLSSLLVQIDKDEPAMLSGSAVKTASASPTLGRDDCNPGSAGTQHGGRAVSSTGMSSGIGSTGSFLRKALGRQADGSAVAAV